MSNSYKKAVYKDGYDSTWKPVMKRLANKAVRNYDGPIPDGSAYKRIFNSWNICDFVSDCRFGDEPPLPDEHRSFVGDDGEYYIYK